MQFKEWTYGGIRSFRREYTPMSFLGYHGRLQVVDAQGMRFLFDLEGRLKWVAVQEGERWPGAGTALRRTLGNHWLIYEQGVYDAAFALTGRYYIPRPLLAAQVKARLSGFDLLASRVGVHGFQGLASQAMELWRLLGGTVPVLPPECSSVDYDVVPLFVTRGCLHNCSFCSVKSGIGLERLKWHEIVKQIEGLARYLGTDSINYNSLFLGQNDALAADPALIIGAASEAFHRLGLGRSIMRGSNLFLFASVDSLLDAPDHLFLQLDALPYEQVHINVGLESFDQETLERLGKPVTGAMVMAAFRRGLDLARGSVRLRFSFNVVTGPGLSEAHHRRLEEELMALDGPTSRCTIYVSPLLGHGWRDGELRRRVLGLKAASRLVLHLYQMVPL